MNYLPLSLAIPTVGWLLYLAHRDSWASIEYAALWLVLLVILCGALACMSDWVRMVGHTK